MAKSKKEGKPKKNRSNVVKRLKIIDNNNKIIGEYRKTLK